MNDRGELLAGFDTIARLFARTLGPSSGLVLNGISSRSSETLVDSATIARRITSLESSSRTAGAAILRELVRTIGTRYGDGGATTAVLCRAILNHAIRVVVAGANPVLVRRGIQAGVRVARDELKTQAAPIGESPALVGIAAAATGDQELAEAIADLVDVLGFEGAIQIEEPYASKARVATALSYDFVDGARWRARPADRRTLGAGATELTLFDPVVAVVDAALNDAAQVRPLLEACQVLPDRPPLLVVAPEIGDDALRMLAVNDARGTMVCVPVVLTTARTRMSDDFADLALLTGAEVLAAERGTPVEKVRADQFGRAARVLVERGHLTVNGGQGDRGELVTSAARLRDRARDLDDDSAHDRLWLRQARLLGKVGVLRVDAPTSHELDARKALAEKVVRLVRSAVHDGVVPGGGVAYLDCVPAVRGNRANASHEDEAFGIDAVCVGLEAPFRQIVRNARAIEPDVALAKVRELGPGHGFDAMAGDYIDVRQRGIQDVAAVAAGALEGAGATAGLLVSAKVVTTRA